MPEAYYNEIDPYAIGALQALMEDGFIMRGKIDSRPIQEVQPSDVKGFTQCHFFAGGGLWSVALRLAGWPDARPVWTGSCPCQPYSVSGKNARQSDERHLWPYWARLIRECDPAKIYGEQVAAAIAAGWADDVAHDLEAQNYAFASAVLPACGVKGAWHQRDRLWFVADGTGHDERGTWQPAESHRPEELQARGHSASSRFMAYSSGIGSWAGLCQGGAQQDGHGASGRSGAGCDVDDSAGARLEGRPRGGLCGEAASERPRDAGVAGPSGGALDDTRCDGSAAGLSAPARRSEGFAEITEHAGGGDDIIWLACPDGKFRPTVPGVRLLAHGYECRVPLLSLAGNAIDPRIAAQFIIATS